MTTTVDMTSTLFDMLKATPIVALMAYALYKLVMYVQTLITAADARQLAHAADLRAMQDKHDIAQAKNADLLIGITRDNVASAGQIATAIGRMDDNNRTSQEQLMNEMKDIKSAVARTTRNVNGSKPKPATA